MSTEKDSIQQFRQPLVTAIALILGFSIGFLADWVTEDNFELSDNADYVLLMGMIISSSCLIWSLLRILRMDYPKDEVEKFYRLTMRLFILGIASLFLCILVSFLI